MSGIPSKYAVFSILVALFLLPGLWSCADRAQSEGEIAITTTSPEAYQSFLDGRELFENLRIDEAREHFDKAIETDPDFAMAHYYRAVTATSQADFRAHLDHAVALAPGASRGEQLMTESLKASADNHPVKAIELSRELATMFPNDKRAHQQLGFYHDAQQEYEKAVASYQRALEIDPEYAPVYNAMGYAYRSMESYTEAEKAFQQYIDLLPGEANPYDSMADLLLRMGRYDDAIEHYRKAANLNPNFAISERKIGICLVFKGDYEAAREAFSSALQMERTAAGRVTDMGMIATSFLYEGNIEEALTYADRSHELALEAGNTDQQAYAHAMKGRIYLETGQFDEAAASMAECLKIVEASNLSEAVKDDFARLALFDEAHMAARMNDIDAALQKAQAYKENVEAGNDPQQIENYHMLLGLIHYENGDDEKAIKQLQQADPENPYAVYYMALAVARSGDTDKAGELYNRVANWNQNSLMYSFVRNDAIRALEQPAARK